MVQTRSSSRIQKTTIELRPSEGLQISLPFGSEAVSWRQQVLTPGRDRLVVKAATKKQPKAPPLRELAASAARKAEAMGAQLSVQERRLVDNDNMTRRVFSALRLIRRQGKFTSRVPQDFLCISI